MDIKGKVKALNRVIPVLFLALKRKDTPLIAKVFAGMTIGYALSPIDLIPDFIPIIGYLDDLIIIPLLASLAYKLIPDGIKNECKAEAEGMWKDGKPKKWYYALPIVALWILIIIWIGLKVINHSK
jgi:uncharacterized membrane protein YkvA (DUF1232 family)